MSFFGKIKNAIFGSAEAATPETGAQDTAVNPAAVVELRTVTDSGAVNVDIAVILDAAVKANGQNLDWKRSIVDLLKALNIDSSLAARKELAAELSYAGDTNDSATMNMWLHKAVIQKLKENGGIVPPELLN